MFMCVILYTTVNNNNVASIFPFLQNLCKPRHMKCWGWRSCGRCTHMLTGQAVPCTLFTCLGFKLIQYTCYLSFLHRFQIVNELKSFVIHKQQFSFTWKWAICVWSTTKTSCWHILRLIRESFYISCNSLDQLWWWWWFPLMLGFRGKVWNIIPLPTFFLKWRSAGVHQLHSLGQGSVHSGSASWDCGQVFPDELCVSSFPW